MKNPICQIHHIEMSMVLSEMLKESSRYTYRCQMMSCKEEQVIIEIDPAVQVAGWLDQDEEDGVKL
jgi:hypothetical protein